jgi:outer membrane autotransporter protein
LVVEASATGRPTVSFSIPVTASTYTLSADRTPVSQQITRSGSASLAVQLQRSGSSVQPLQNASINWSVSPADGSSLTPMVAITDALGIGSTVFAPVATGRYTVTASFDTGAAGKAVVSQEFTIDVVDDQRRLDAISGDGQAGEPGSNLPQPLVVQALENGAPAAGALIEWSGSGGVLLSSPHNPTPGSPITDPAGSDGRSTVQVTLPAQPGSFVITATWILNTAPNKGSATPGPSVSFTVTSMDASAVELVATEGDGQQGLVGQQGTPLGAQLLIDGAPAGADFLVSWTVQQGDLQLSAPSSRTDASGTARIGLRFGNATGESLVRASSVRGTEALFRVFATAEASLIIISGDAQSGAPNSELGEDFVVEARAASGGVLDGVQVLWAVSSGGGSLSSERTPTDSAGRARTRLTLGPSVGEQLVTASLTSGQQVSFRATASGQSRGLSVVRGDLQRGLVFTRPDVPLEVRLTNDDGVPIPGSTILWELEGDAELDAPSSVTDAEGLASNGLRFGASAGVVRISARAAGVINPVVFTLNSALPGVSGLGGDGQTGTVNTPLPEDLSVNLALPAAKGLAGVPVQWQILTGGGSLAATTSTSDAQGKASNRWTLGAQVGEQSVQATLPGGQQVVFRATAQAEGGLVGTLRIVSGTPQTLPTHAPSAPLVVEVVDAAGQPLSGVLIEWAGDAQKVSLRDDSNRTGSDGRASNIAKVLIPGAVSVSARVGDSDIPEVSFQLNGGVAEIPGLGDEERDIGTVVDNACPALAALSSRTPEQEDLFQRCSEFVGNAGDHPDEVRDALGQLPTDIGPTLSGQANESVGTQLDNLDLRLHMIRGEKTGTQRNQFNLSLWTPDGALPLSFLPSAFMAAAAGEEDQAGLDFDRWGFFATGQIGRGQVDAGERSPEFDYDIAGLTFGADYRFSDRLVAGLALGYSDNDAELAGSRGEVATKGWTLSGYATWYSASAWYVDGTLLLGRLDYDLRRRLSYSITALDGGRTMVDQVASASTDGDLFGTSLSVGRDWQKGPWNINGYFRGQYARVKTDAFVEQMIEGLPGQGLALAVDSRSTESMTSALGVRATYVLSRDWGILMPNLSIEWEHEFEDDPGRLTARLAFDPTATPIERFGDALDSDYFNLGIGVSALFPGGRSAYLFYEELVGASRVSQGLLSLGVRFEF